MGDLYFGVSTGDGGYEYKPVGHLEHVDLIDYGSMLPRPGEDMYGHFTRVKPGTNKLGWVATTEIIWHGNSLYSKFPKKGKRKLRRYNRCRRVSIIRLNKIWGKNKARPWEMQYELSKETENWNGCYPDPNLGHGENWEKEEKQ